MVLPAENESLKKEVLERQLNEESMAESASEYVHKMLAKLLSNEVNYHTSAERLRRGISNIPETPFQIFKCIDSANTHFIQLDNLQTFFISQSLPAPSEAEIQRILSRLDTDGDGKVSYLDFLDAVTPFEVEKKEVSTYSPLRPRMSRYYGLQTSPNQEDIHSSMSQFAKGEKKFLAPELDSVNETSARRPKSQIMKTPSKILKTPSKEGLSEEPQVASGDKKSESPYIFSPASDAKETKIILEVFHQQIDIEKRIEKAKLDLFRQEDIDFPAAYSFLSNKNAEGIKYQTLKEKYEELKVDPEHLLFIFKRYNAKADGLLSREDVGDMIQPQAEASKEILRENPKGAIDLDKVYKYLCHHL